MEGETGATVAPPSRVFAYEWQGKDLRDTECVRVASKGLTERHFCASVQRTRSRRGMPPRVFCKKSPQAIENKRLERGKERKERKRVRNGMIRRDLHLRWDSPWMRPEVLRGALDGYTPTIVGRPVATGSMRNVLRTGEILTLRGADDGRSGWLRKHTRGCGGIRRPDRDTVSNLGYRIPHPLLFVK